MSRLKLFLLSLTLTTSVLLGMAYAGRSKRTASYAPVLQPVAEGVFVTAQLKPGDMFTLKRRGIRTLVDQRPDGEASDQATSSEMERAAKGSGIAFHYVPIPHESIPGSAVDELNEIVAHQEKPILLYCRSGRRAVRTFALEEASRSDGPSPEAIAAMTRAAGFPADDLKADIAQRVARRNHNQVVQTDAH